MKILDARWTWKVNILLIGCECGKKFEHPANRKVVKCACGRTANLMDLKAETRKAEKIAEFTSIEGG